jgi:hypothetical protein
LRILLRNDEVVPRLNKEFVKRLYFELNHRQIKLRKRTTKRVNIDVMQKIFQRTKKLIGLSLATLLLFISTLTIAPAPARADNCVASFCPTVNLDGEEGVVGFAAGVVTGILFSDGGATAVATTAAASVTAVATTVATASAAFVASPIVVPVAVIGGIVAGGYLIEQAASQSQEYELDDPIVAPASNR